VKRGKGKGREGKGRTGRTGKGREGQEGEESKVIEQNDRAKKRVTKEICFNFFDL
jgi:hypothetical protein